MRAGRIEQWDAPYNLYHRPATRFVADFVGQGVFLPGTALGPGRVSIELGVLEGELPHGPAAGHARRLLLRPDDVVHDDASELQAEVVARRSAAPSSSTRCGCHRRATALSLVPSHHNHAIGEHIGIRLDAQHLVGFPLVVEKVENCPLLQARWIS